MLFKFHHDMAEVCCNMVFRVFVLSTVNALKFLYTKVSDRIPFANSADPDQTAPEGAV